ncbi:hypothetical protein [Natronobiforma cellulositropha]|uniref:hypothetical protein n=1 Tax=Natronobiforma cellulositropha TaxID=1679076 RepID=UPI0021D58A0C|nr:hypothetical protein [Natronobiforma cellulositropha]
MSIESDIIPDGPIWFGGDLVTTTADEQGYDYSLRWLPDKNNRALREAGEPMRFYYLPQEIRLATEHDSPHYQFHLQDFAGVLDPDVNVGAPGHAEVSGGYLTFTTTMGVPEPVMEASKDELKALLEDRYEGHPLLGWNNSLPEPAFDNVPIVDSETRLHPVSVRDAEKRLAGEDELDDVDIPPWGWHVEGEGKGPINPTSTNAFSVLLGNFPTLLIRGAAESGESNITVENDITYNVNAPEVSITVRGEWEAIFEHFSAAAEGGIFWLRGELNKEVESMVREGVLEVEIDYNEEFVEEGDLERWESAANEIADTFLERASETILSQEAPDVEAAEASSPWWRWSGDAELKDVQQEHGLSLEYSKRITGRTNRYETISTTMDGLFDQLQTDEDAWDRYFSRVYLDEGWQKVYVIATVNANWGDGERAGDPIHHVSCDVGYPTSEGDVQFRGQARYRDDPTDPDLSEENTDTLWVADTPHRLFVWEFIKQDHTDAVENPNEIHVQERIAFDEAGAYVLVDTLERAYTTEDHTLEIRADSAGHLAVGPIEPDMPLGSEQVAVVLTLRAPDVPDKRIQFSADEPGPAYWDVWYPPEEHPGSYEYKVEAVVRPPMFGLEELRWESDWRTVEGNGPLIADVPPAPEELREDLREYLQGD